MKVKLLIFLCILKSIACDPIPGEDEARIVGGSTVPDGGAPYQCSMQVFGQHYCGCAIISAEYVLTAAHCSGQSNAQIIVGTNDWQSGGQKYNVEREIRYPGYDSNSHQNDIALAKVQGSIQFNNKVKPIKYADENKEVPAGTPLLATGWGQLSHPGNAPTQLQEIRLKAISHVECKKVWPRINEGSLCTLNGRGEGMCMGDSGGPLVMGDALVGLVSFGNPCANGRPDVFTRVSNFASWIRSNAN